MTAAIAMPPSPAPSVPRAVTDALNSGGMVCLVDPDIDRGGLAAAAAQMTARHATTMATHGRGLLCVVVDYRSAARLGLAHMPHRQGTPGGRPYFLASVEAATCTGTGISAADRALTMRAAGAPQAGPADLHSPGHVMPILVPAKRQLEGSLPQRAKQLVSDATPYDIAAWCDILDDDGETAGAAACRRLAGRLGLPVAVV